MNCLFTASVDTARALLDHPAPDCFQYVVASPAYSVTNGSKISVLE